MPLIVAVACFFASIATSVAVRAGAAPTVTVRLADHGRRIEVVGLLPAALAAVRNAKLPIDQWRRILSASVATDGSTPAAPMLGTYSIADNCLNFTPRFALRPGLKYRAVFDPAALPGHPMPGAQRVEVALALPAPPSQPAAAVAAVFPSGDALPANLLKLYIHFTAPMTRGDSYRYVRIVDARGVGIPDAFLELGEELWNPSGTRLTILFDPGRIKRGLKPNEDVGAPLVEGRRYALVVDAGWPDARHVPLAKEFRKPFRVTAPDYEQPDPHRWRLNAPPAGTREPLVVEFDEPLDHALLDTAIALRGPTGKPVAHRASASTDDASRQFQPTDAWQAGVYELTVDPTLEDRAGNSVGRAFETTHPAGASADRPVVLRFTVASAP